MDGTFIVPSPEGTRWAEVDSVPVELARHTQGRLFEKQILSKGQLIHPKTGEKINIDDRFMTQLMSNFENNVCDIVQVPVANDANQHVESAWSNIGEVTALREREGKLYAVIDARDPAAADKLGKTMLGASAFLSTNYTDSRTGRKAGPTLLHVAVTNRPYVVGLEPYKEIIAATSDTEGDVTVLTQEETVGHPTPPSLDELKAALKAAHGIDVDALQASASQGVDATSLTQAITDALAANPALSLTAGNGETITPQDLVGAVVELSQQNATLARGYDDMRRERATEKVDALIGDGYILPKQRAFAIKLALTSPEDFTEFVPADKIVPVGEQTGFTPPRDEREQGQQAEEVVRLTNAYKEYFDPSVTPNGSRRR